MPKYFKTFWECIKGDTYGIISTKEQHLDRGIIEIKRFCENQKIKLESIFTDKITGKNFDRPRYTVLVEDVLRVGDTLIITELDRLGRNKQEILKQLRFLEEKGVRVMVLELPTTLFDLSQMENNLAKMMIETINNMMIELYASMAQAEMEKKVSNNEDKRTILYIFVFIFVSGKKDSRISGVCRSVINRECPIKI